MAVSITSELLIRLAGEPAYRRGVSVYKNGQIERWGVSGNTVRAVVEGTEIYGVTLTIGSRRLDGECSCPASDHFAFCKHCVAVALAWDAHQHELEKKQSGSPIERISAYLEQLDRDRLVGHLLDLIEGDHMLEKQWAIRADLAASGTDAKFIRKQITRAFPYRDIWEYRKVAAYFSNAEAIFDLILEPLRSLPAEERFKLSQYAVERLNKALDRVDDSGGYRFDIEGKIKEILVGAFNDLDWSNKKKAGFLVKQMEASPDIYPLIPEEFVDQDDAEMMAELVQACEKRWAAIVDQDGFGEQNRYSFNRLPGFLLDMARKDGDFEREVAIMAQLARNEFDYCRLCEKHLSNGDLDRAEYWLEKARAGGARRNVLPLQIRIASARGDTEAALALQWDVFKDFPDVRNYALLRQLNADNGLTDEDCWRKAETLLKTGARPRWGRPPLHELVDFYLYTGTLDKAVDIARCGEMSGGQLARVALAIAGADPDTAIDFCLRAVEGTANMGSNQAYDDAVALLKKFEGELNEEDRPTLVARIDNLREVKSLARKPNFMAALDKAYPPEE